jgi:hypothetical protein
MPPHGAGPTRNRTREQRAAVALRPAARQPSGNGSRSRTKAHSASLMAESYRGRRSGRSAASRTDGRGSHSQEWTNWTRRPGPRDTSTPGPLASRWIRQPRATKRPFFHAPAPADSPEPGPCSNPSDHTDGQRTASQDGSDLLGLVGAGVAQDDAAQQVDGFGDALDGGWRGLRRDRPLPSLPHHRDTHPRLQKPRRPKPHRRR